MVELRKLGRVQVQHHRHPDRAAKHDDRALAHHAQPLGHVDVDPSQVASQAAAHQLGQRCQQYPEREESAAAAAAVERAQLRGMGWGIQGLRLDQVVDHLEHATAHRCPGHGHIDVAATRSGGGTGPQGLAGNGCANGSGGMGILGVAVHVAWQSGKRSGVALAARGRGLRRFVEHAAADGIARRALPAQQAAKQSGSVEAPGHHRVRGAGRRALAPQHQ